MSSDDCRRRLALKRGDVVTIGKTRWRVENAYGLGTTWVVKDGTKGRKLYSIRPTEIEPRCCVEVLEINPGSGDIIPGAKPAARGCAVGSEPFAGTRRRKRRR